MSDSYQYSLDTGLADASTALHIVFAYSSIQSLLGARNSHGIIDAAIRISSESVPHCAHEPELSIGELSHAGVIGIIHTVQTIEIFLTKRKTIFKKETY